MSDPTRVGAPVRQKRTLAAIAQQVNAHPWLEGAILIGSLAAGKADAASDIDLIVCVRPAQFDRAWAYRHRLHVTGAIAYWDERRDPSREIGAHRWVTDDLVLVEALLATPDSGVRLAPPWEVIVGADDLADRFPHRPPIDRAEFNTTDVHPIDRAFDALRRALREHASAGTDGRDRHQQ